MHQDSAVEATCTSCSTVYRVSGKLIGKKVFCKNCGTSFEIASHGGESLPVIGKLALKYRFIRQDQLDAAVDAFNAQNDSASKASFEEILLDRGFISEKQRSILLNAMDYLEIRQQDKEIGEIMLRKELCDRQKVEEALAEQSRRFKETQSVCRIDDILSDWGVSIQAAAVPGGKADESEASLSVLGSGEVAAGTGNPAQASAPEQREKLKILGDVDQETGDIEFDGHVVVSGCIQRGYRVKSGSLAAAEVSGGEADISGDITVSGGIVGAGIRAGGAVRARYIKGSRISAYGDVLVEKEINESEIVTSGACRIPQGTILSSEIAAKMGIFAGDVGTEMSNPAKLKVGVDEHIEKELLALDAALQERRSVLENLKEREQGFLQSDQELYARITELAQVQDRSTIERRAIQKEMEKGEADTQALSETADRLQDLQDRIKAAEDEIDKRFAERDGISGELKSVAEKIQGVEAEIQKIQSTICTLSVLPQRQQANPKITVYRSIFEGTVVTTPHATKVLPRTGMNLLISESKKRSSGTEEKWEIAVFFRKKEETASQVS